MYLMSSFVVALCLLLGSQHYVESLNCFVCTNGTIATTCPYPIDINGKNVMPQTCGADFPFCITAARSVNGVAEVYRLCTKGDYTTGSNYVDQFNYTYNGKIYNINIKSAFNIFNCNTSYCNDNDITPTSIGNNNQTTAPGLNTTVKPGLNNTAIRLSYSGISMYTFGLALPYYLLKTFI